jgi:hypothetical protein
MMILGDGFAFTKTIYLATQIIFTALIKSIKI